MKNTNDELREICRRTAYKVEAYASGSLVCCDDCGEWVPFDCEACPECGEELCMPDESTACDWLEATELYGERVELDFCNGYPASYRGVRLMVACGGPNIYVDTVGGEVVGYWGGDEARVWLNRDACNAIDDAEVERLEACGLEVRW